MTDTRQALALLPCPFCGHDEPTFERIGTPRQSCIVVCGHCGCRHESSDEGSRSGSSWNARAALSAQPVAGAVAHQDEQADALRFRWLCEHPDWHFIERLCREFVADSSMEFLTELRRVIDARRSVELGPFEEHAALSAQPVALPAGSSGLTDEKCDDLLRKSGLWPLACVSPQNRALLRGLCHESAVAAQPVEGAAPAPEPSAQGEPVAWEVRAYNRTHRIVVRSDVADELASDMRRQRMQEVEVRPLYASAPSTQPHAVVEAVPLTDERIAELINGCDFSTMVTADDVFYLIARAVESELRGIAPKAAQPVEGER